MWASWGPNLHGVSAGLFGSPEPAEHTGHLCGFWALRPQVFTWPQWNSMNEGMRHISTSFFFSDLGLAAPLSPVCSVLSTLRDAITYSLRFRQRCWAPDELPRLLLNSSHNPRRPSSIHLPDLASCVSENMDRQVRSKYVSCMCKLAESKKSMQFVHAPAMVCLKG